MRNQIYIDSLPTAMVNNKVLVGVEDTFEGFKTKGGIELVNLTEADSWADSPQFNISEFVMRHGKVLLVPNVISKGSFTYDTDVELKPGDTIWWNLISFQNHIPLIYNKKLFLMVDYHEILARKRDDKITPINGMGLFTPVTKSTTALSYCVQTGFSDEWILDALPERNVRYKDDRRSASDVWEVGDKVRLLVGGSPFKLEGTINTVLEKELYACPMNYVICTV
jgi:hypothetical protein